MILSHFTLRALASAGVYVAIMLSFASGIETKELHSSKSKSGARVEVVHARPGPGTVETYLDFNTCDAPIHKQVFNGKHYDVDICHNLNPSLYNTIKITEPAICPNGTRALFARYRYSGCSGPFSAVTQVSDNVLGKCIDSSNLWSFAFVCDGVQKNGGLGDGWFRPLAMFSFILGTTVFAFGVLTAVVFGGWILVVVGTLVLFFWVMFKILKLILVS